MNNEYAYLGITCHRFSHMKSSAGRGCRRTACWNRETARLCCDSLHLSTMGARYLPVKAFEVDVTHIRGTWWWKLRLIWLSCCPRLRNLSDQVKFPVWVSGPTFNSQILQVPSAMDQGWIKSRLPGLFRPDSFRTLMYYRQFQKFLLVTDNFGPNRFGKICAEVTFSVKENIKQAFLRERQIYSPSGTIVSFDSCS